MFTAPVMMLSLLFTPVNYGSSCQPGPVVPDIQVTAERGTPNFSYDASTADLTQRSTGSYKPAGVTGPSWHTQGLTQSNIKIAHRIEEHSITAANNSYACIYIDRISVQVILSPTVWVANEFPLGSCMYNAIRDHEMKHVNVDRIVTDRHLSMIRAALVQATRGRTYIGPLNPAMAKANFDEFMSQLKDVLEDQQQKFSEEEERAQQAVDTLQEYERISHMCPGQGR